MFNPCSKCKNDNSWCLSEWQVVIILNIGLSQSALHVTLGPCLQPLETCRLAVHQMSSDLPSFPITWLPHPYAHLFLLLISPAVTWLCWTASFRFWPSPSSSSHKPFYLILWNKSIELHQFCLRSVHLGPIPCSRYPAPSTCAMDRARLSVFLWFQSGRLTTTWLQLCT